MLICRCPTFSKYQRMVQMSTGDFMNFCARVWNLVEVWKNSYAWAAVAFTWYMQFLHTGCHLPINARKADYKMLTESDTFSKKFCQVRGGKMLMLARERWTFIHTWRNTLNQRNICQQQRVSVLKDAVKESLMEAKFAFFSSAYVVVESLFNNYQSPKPMATSFQHCYVYWCLGLSKRSKHTRKKLLKLDLNSRDIQRNHT